MKNIFTNFFNKHISLLTADEAVLTAIDYTLEESMALVTPHFTKYTDDELIQIAKDKFSFFLPNETLLMLGDLFVNKGQRFNTLDKPIDLKYYFSLFGLNEIIYKQKPKQLTADLVFNGEEYNVPDTVLTDLQDEFNYTDYLGTLNKVDGFINVNKNLTNFNTVLKPLSDKELIELVSIGVKYFLKGSFVLFNLQNDIIGQTYDNKSNKTYLLGVNYLQQVYFGYIKADGRVLSKINYNALNNFLPTNNTSDDIITPNDLKKLYLGFFTDYIYEEFVLTDTSSFPSLLDFLEFQKDSLKSLIVTNNGGNTNSFNTVLNLYRLKTYLNYSGSTVLFTLLPSVTIKSINITDNLTDNDLLIFTNWYKDRNVFDGIIRVNGSQLFDFDYEYFMLTLNWVVEITGNIIGNFAVGEVKLLPPNLDSLWLPTNNGNYQNVYTEPLLWYVIRDTYGVERREANYTAFFKLPNLGINYYIYKGNQTQYDALTQLDFTFDSVQGINFDATIFNNFTNLEDLFFSNNCLNNNVVITDIHATSLTGLRLLGTNTIIYDVNIAYETIGFTDIAGTQNSMATYNNGINTVTVPTWLFVYDLLNYCENLDRFEWAYTDLNAPISALVPALPSGTDFSNITNFYLTNVNTTISSQGAANLVNVFNTVLITNLNIVNSDISNTTNPQLNLGNISGSALFKNSTIGNIFGNGFSSLNVTDSTLNYCFFSAAITSLILNNVTLSNTLIFGQLVLPTIDFSPINLIATGVLVSITSNTATSYTHVTTTQNGLSHNLRLFGDSLTSVNLKNNTQLSSIYIDSTSLEYENISNLNLTTLNTIDFHNLIYADNILNLATSNILTNLTVVNGVGLETVTLPNPTSVILESVSITATPSLTTLNNLDIHTDIELLDLSGSSIIALDITANRLLIDINLDNTQLPATEIGDILQNLVDNGEEEGIFTFNVFSGSLNATDNANIATLQSRLWLITIT